MCEVCSQPNVVDTRMFTNEDLNRPRCRICGKPYEAKVEFLVDPRFYNVCNFCRNKMEERDVVSGYGYLN